MVSFVYPYLLYLLFIVPVVLILHLWTRISRKLKLEKFGRLSVIGNLMPDTSNYMGWVKIVLECVAIAFIVIVLARPYTSLNASSETDEETTSGIEVMICMDVSNSMLASSTDDPKGVSRLQRSKFILEKLIDRLDDDKVGLIVFAGEAYTQLPITSDFVSAKMFVNGLSTDMVPTQGTAIGTAIDMAMTSFTPESDFQKAIIIITDGENFEDDAIGEAKRAAESGIEVDVIGVGSGKGAPIPLNPNHTEYMKDFNGNQVTTALNEQMAREIAKAGDGEYFQGSSNAVVSDLVSKLDELSKTEYIRKKASNPADELFPLAALIALILLVVDGLLPYCKISWLKDVNIFTNSIRDENK